MKMILTKEEILQKIKKGIIKIEPFEIESIGPASIDLTLDNEIRIFNGKRIVGKDIDYTKIKADCQARNRRCIALTQTEFFERAPV